MDGFDAFYQASYPRLVALLAGLTGDQAAARERAREAFGWARTGWSGSSAGDGADPGLGLGPGLGVSEGRVRQFAVRRVPGTRGGDPLPATPLSEALTRLTPQQREVIVLYYLGGLTADEIAELTAGATPGMIKTRLAAARRGLDRELREPGEPGQPGQPGNEHALTEDELRERLADWVRPATEQPVPDPGELPQVHTPRGSRRRWLAIAAAVVVLAGAGTGLAVGLSPSHPARAATTRPRPQPAREVAFAWVPGAWTAPGKVADGTSVPPYFIGITLPANGQATTTTVTATATGTQTATLNPPPGRYFAGVAAAADNRTFVLAAVPDGLGLGNSTATQITEVKFYELRLSPSGQPGSPVLLLTLRTIADPGFALSADGSQLAVVDYTGNLEVISLTTGTHRTWRTPGVASQPGWLGEHTLAFYFEPASAVPPPSSTQFEPVKYSPLSGLRLLDTTAPGTDLVASSRLLIREQLINGSPVLGVIMTSADGTRLIASAYSDVSSQGIAEAGKVEEFDAGTGKLTGAITPAVTISSGTNDFLQCMPLWSNPSGAAVLSFCADGNNSSAGGIYYAHGKIESTSVNTPLNQGGSYFGLDSVAW